MVILHAGEQGCLPSKISFLAHKFIRFNRSSCAGGITLRHLSFLDLIAVHTRWEKQAG